MRTARDQEAGPERWTVQLGSSSDSVVPAPELRSRVRQAVGDTAIIRLERPAPSSYRLRLGLWTSASEALRAAERLESLGQEVWVTTTPVPSASMLVAEYPISSGADSVNGEARTPAATARPDRPVDADEESEASDRDRARPTGPTDGSSAADTLIRLSSDSSMIVRRTTLEEIGLDEGVVAEGPFGERTFYFQLPSGAEPTGGRLILNFRFSRPMHDMASVRVMVNGELRTTVLRGDADEEGHYTLELELDEEALTEEFLSVTMVHALVVSDDRCFDQRLGNPSVRITPDSWFAFELPASRVRTVRTAWLTLPDSVRVGIPDGSLDPGEFTAAYRVAAGLSERGIAWDVTRDPEKAHVVVQRSVGSGDEGAVASAGGNGSPPQGDVSDVGVLRLQDRGPAARPDSVPRFVIELGGNVREAAARLLGGAFGPLTKSEQVRVVEASEGSDRSQRPFLLLGELGLSAGEQMFGAQAGWTLGVGYRQLPPGRVPSRLELEVVSPSMADSPPTLLNIYLNNTLVRSGRLEDTGRRERFETDLPRFLLEAQNQIRIVAQRQIRGGDCSVPQMAYPFQVMEASRLELAPAPPNPEVFQDLVPHLNGNAAFYLPDAARTEPASYLKLLVSLGNDFWSRLSGKEIRFYSESPPPPDRPFLLVGGIPSWIGSPPLHLDRGRIVIREADDETRILEMERLDDWTILQAVTGSGHPGLWVNPATYADEIPTANISLGTANVAILDRTGSLVTLSTRRDQVLESQYPEAGGWMDLLNRFRTWLLLALLLVVTTVVVYLYRRTKEHEATEATAAGDDGADGSTTGDPAGDGGTADGA